MISDTEAKRVFQVVEECYSKSSIYENRWRYEIMLVLKRIEFFKIVGGKIKATHSYFDSREMIEKLREYKMNLK